MWKHHDFENGGSTVFKTVGNRAHLLPKTGSTSTVKHHEDLRSVTFGFITLSF